MPTYCYRCDKCEVYFENVSYMSECHLLPECPQCKKTKQVHRDFLAESVSVYEGPKTLGSLADRNSERFSSDKLEYLKEKTRTKRE